MRRRVRYVEIVQPNLALENRLRKRSSELPGLRCDLGWSTRTLAVHRYSGIANRPKSDVPVRSSDSSPVSSRRHSRRTGQRPPRAFFPNLLEEATATAKQPYTSRSRLHSVTSKRPKKSRSISVNIRSKLCIPKVLNALAKDSAPGPSDWPTRANDHTPWTKYA